VSKKSLVIVLASCFLAAFAIRFYAAARCSALPEFSDMAAYNAAALAEGIPTSLPPGYPLCLRIIYAIFGACNYKAVFAVQGLVGSLTVVLIYWITRKIANNRAAVLAACMATVYPNFIVYGLTTLAETVALFFVVILLLVFVSAMHEKRRSILAAVILCVGAAFRPVMFFFIPGVFASLRKRLAFVITLAVILTPLVFAAMSVGSNVQRAARGFYKAYNPKSTAYYLDMSSTDLMKSDLPSSAYIKAALAFIKHNKWKMLDIIYEKTSVVFSRGWDPFVITPILRDVGAMRSPVCYLMSYAYIPIMLLGFMGMIRFYDKENRFLALMALSYLSVFILISIFKVRYRLLIEPILIIYAAAFVERSFRGLRVPRFGAWFKHLFSPPEIEPLTSQAESCEVSNDRARTWSRLIPFRCFKDWDILLIILLAGLAIRVYTSLSFEESTQSPQTTEYTRMALRQRFDGATPPLYPLFLRAIYGIFGKNNFKAVFMIQGILNALVIIMMYTIVARLCNRKAGVIAAALSAVYPNFLFYNLTVLTDSLAVVLTVALMATACSRLRNGPKALVSAALVAAAIFLRPMLICLTPGVLATAKRWRLFLLALILLLAPYAARNAMRHQTIEPVYGARTYDLGLDNFTNSRGLRGFIDAIYRNSSAVVAKGWELPNDQEPDSMKRNSTYAAAYCFTIVMILGLIGLVRFYRKEHEAAVLPIIFYVMALILFSRFEIEYRVPIEPVFIAYASILLSGGRCK
jgi:4-amino-4-deoxy-L-arabinose transferase-like glycosyltransferase